MEFKGFKLNIILLVIALVITVFFAGRYYNKIYNLEKPIVEDIMSFESVEDVNLINNNGKMDIEIELLSGSNFFVIYKDIDSIMDEKFSNNRGEIIVKNKSNEDLEEVYYLLQYSLYEGINNKEFVDMEETIKDIVNKSNLDNYKLWIDTQAVYLELNDENKSFYKRIPYNNNIRIESEGGGQYA